MVLLASLGKETYFMGDFRAFYCAGSAILQRANPYLEEPLRTCEAQTGPPAEPAFLHPVAVPAPLPPYALLMFAPFARLPFPLAIAAYLMLSIAAMSAATLLFSRVASTSSIVMNLVFAGITGTVTYYVGQPMPLVFIAMAGAAYFLRRGFWNAASACAAAATIEPHVALPAIVAMLVAFPRTRLPLALGGLVLSLASVSAVGLPITILYLREVVPAHALANAYEWQFSLTSVLTSFGVGAPLAVGLGELMFTVMTALGVAVAYRLWRSTGNGALIALLPPAFGMFGGVHVHFQQLAIAFPAFLWIYAHYPRVRSLVATGLSLAMIPWNVVGSSVVNGISPVLVGCFSAATMGRRRGLVLAILAALIGFSILPLAYFGLGPPPVHFVAHPYASDALAEESWGAFSRATLARPSFLMQWLRLPTLLGLACGLVAIVRVAFMEKAIDHAAALRHAPALAEA
jgi:hypothetical protein